MKVKLFIKLARGGAVTAVEDKNSSKSIQPTARFDLTFEFSTFKLFRNGIDYGQVSI